MLDLPVLALVEQLDQGSYLHKGTFRRRSYQLARLSQNSQSANLGRHGFEEPVFAPILGWISWPGEPNVNELRRFECDVPLAPDVEPVPGVLAVAGTRAGHFHVRDGLLMRRVESTRSGAVLIGS